jgi:hypothetical protein
MGLIDLTDYANKCYPPLRQLSVTIPRSCCHGGTHRRGVARRASVAALPAQAPAPKRGVDGLAER